jgi:hypothetical protein
LETERRMLSMGTTQSRAERELKERVKRARSRKIQDLTFEEDGRKKEREGLRKQAEIRSRQRARELGMDLNQKKTEPKSMEDYLK